MWFRTKRPSGEFKQVALLLRTSRSESGEGQKDLLDQGHQRSSQHPQEYLHECYTGNNDS